MRLTELMPQFLKVLDDKTYQQVDSISGADGIQFKCPKCAQVKDDELHTAAARAAKYPGVHYVICWAPHVPQTISPTPGRWNLEGTGYDDLTLVNGSSSVLLKGGCNAHFWIRRSEICWAN